MKQNPSMIRTMKKYIRLFLGVFVVTTFIGGCAQTPTENSSPSSHLSSQMKADYALDAIGIAESYSQQEIIDQIMFESGMDEVIEQKAARISARAYQAPPAMVKKEDYEKFQSHMAQVYEPVKMRKIITDYLNEQYDVKQFSELLALLKTPAVQEMTALYLAAQIPEALYEMRRSGDAIMREVSSERLTLVRQIDEAARFTESSVDISMVYSGMNRRSMNKIVPAKYRLTKAELEKELKQERMMSMLPARQFTHLKLLYAFRSVDDEVLDDYLKLYQSETVQWGRALEIDAWMKVSENISKEMAALMEQTFIETNAG